MTLASIRKRLQCIGLILTIPDAGLTEMHPAIRALHSYWRLPARERLGGLRSKEPESPDGPDEEIQVHDP